MINTFCPDCCFIILKHFRGFEGVSCYGQFVEKSLIECFKSLFCTVSQSTKLLVHNIIKVEPFSLCLVISELVFKPQNMVKTLAGLTLMGEPVILCQSTLYS